MLAVTVGVACAPVRPVSRAARAALALYGLAVLGSTLSTARTATLRDAAPLPLVYVAMHVPYGLGFLAGCGRWGPPIRALMVRSGVRRAVRR